MNKHIKRFLYVVCYLLLTFFTLFVLALSNAPTWCVPIIVIFPALFLWVLSKIDHYFRYREEEKNISKTNTQYKKNSWLQRKRLPSAKKSRELSDGYINEAKKAINIAYSASSIDAFCRYFEDAKELLQKAMIYERKAGYNSDERPSYLLNYYMNEMQFKKSRKLSDSLIDEAKKSINLAYEASSISSFIEYGNHAIELLQNAMKYEKEAGYNLTESPSYMLDYFNNEYQWRLRDAIERETIYLKSEILGRQHNNKKACCQGFLDEVNAFEEHYSDETKKFAKDAYYQLCAIAGLNIWEKGEKVEDDPMVSIDVMDGHDFEYYCAEILRKNDYQNVQVTKGSGDQGIDILAEKDSIKYAIQCKCYTSDIGNKPVQEAFTGKSIYNCQIAAVLTNRFFTQGAIEAAKATGVLLWDRNKLLSLIEYAQKNGERMKVR